MQSWLAKVACGSNSPGSIHSCLTQQSAGWSPQSLQGSEEGRQLGLLGNPHAR